MSKPPPIQAFYACYLLRSTVRHASLYIGSTPNPVRRLRQHNGESKGGAVRTSKDTLRPWEMTCLVTGFPSKVAALQFEWAWQNSHLTRHISAGSRITQAQMRERYSPRTGKLRKRNARPRMCLSDRLLNLHALLMSASFERWPLRVVFYADDVWRVWKTAVVGKTDCGVDAVMDESSKAPNAGIDELKAIHAVDVGYSGLKAHLEKSRGLFLDAGNVGCTICRHHLSPDGSMSLTCPNHDCKAAGHLECFASSFTKGQDALLPTDGQCPSCGTKLKWVDLVKEMSLRLRGEAEIKKIFKVKKARANKATAQAQDPEEFPDDQGSDAELDDAPPLEDDWHHLSDDDESPTNVTHLRGDPSPLQRRAFTFAAHSEPVIEDSDWDEAEVIC